MTLKPALAVVALLALPAVAHADRTWHRGFPAAARELGEWMKKNPEPAKALVAWDEQEPAQTKKLVAWASAHPTDKLDKFASKHADWAGLQQFAATDAAAVDGFLAWARKNSAAADSLTSTPKGFVWAGGKYLKAEEKKADAPPAAAPAPASNTQH